MNEPTDVNFESFYEQQKSIHGKSATMLWLIIGVVLFIIDPVARFLTWQAAVYFIVGMFAAAIIFGMIGYALQRLVAMILVRTRAVALTAPLAIALYVFDAVLIYFAARWTIRALFA